MNARNKIWVGTGIIAVGAVLSWVGWLGHVPWLGPIGTVLLLLGAVYLLWVRTRG